MKPGFGARGRREFWTPGLCAIVPEQPGTIDHIPSIQNALSPPAPAPLTFFPHKKGS